LVRSRKGTGSATATAGKGLGSLKDSGTEALQLVIAYIKQETLTPLKGLGRYVLFGVAGSLALAVGLVVLAVGFLRLLQGETGTTFEGNWSWAPYLICMVAVLAVGAVAVMAVTRGQADRNDDVRKEAP
jgi:hypothetical protein